ncbi:hypothetical protein [Actinoplanes sp. URMC 104]|uniref:hypothetical protein n=1 Tax=Actinoplanes sp. URMC 104 TaxID=3423409 RepID=UPI003F1B4ECF
MTDQQHEPGPERMSSKFLWSDDAAPIVLDVVEDPFDGSDEEAGPGGSHPATTEP